MESNQCSFRIENGNAIVIHLDQFETRGDNAMEMVQMLVNRDPGKFEGCSGFIHYGDTPPPPDSGREFDLRFSTTVSIGEESSFLPFPCPYSHAWPQVGIQDGPALMSDFLGYKGAWCDTRAFWIGADTHVSRRRLVDLTERSPAILEAVMMGWQRDSPTVRLNSTGRYVSLWDHRHYKYLIDCPGHGYSGRLRWLLASGRPVFIIERQIVEPWHLDLRPWVHFIPVKQDLSDFVAAYRRVDDDPVLYKILSANAQSFASRRLLRERELDRIERLIPNSNA